MEQLYGNFIIKEGRLSAEALRLTIVVSGGARGTDHSTWKDICMKWEAAFIRLFVDEERFLDPKP